MKWLWRTLLVLLALLLILAIVQLLRWQRARSIDPDATLIMPRVQVARMNIQQLDPEATKVLMALMIDQPAPIGLTIDSLEYVMSIAGNEVMRSTYAEKITIPARDSAIIEMPVTIKTQRLVEVLKSLEAQGVDSVEYAMEARFHLPIAFWKKGPMEVRMARRLPLIHLPEVQLRDPVVDKLGFGESRIGIDLAVFNPNAASIAFRELKMTATLEDRQVIFSAVDSLIEIQALDTTVIHMPMTLAPGQVIEGIFDLLVHPKSTPYAYRMEFFVVSDQPAMDNAQFIIVGDGMLDELKALRDKDKKK